MRNNMKNAAILLTAAALVPAAAGEGRAHGVFIYAWAEGGNICTESYFSEDDKVRGGTVTMRNAAGEILGETPTDEAGRACFPAPETATALRFVVDAGQGHRAEYAMPEAEVAAASAARTAQSAPAASAGDAARVKPGAPAASAPALDEVRLRELIREELQAQLAPFGQRLAQATAPKKPGFREIVGGLGWIAGLAALGHFAMSRRKGEKAPEAKA